MPDPTVDQLAAALDAAGDLVAGVPGDAWTSPTPCPAWDVRALVNHVVAGNLHAAAVLRGEAAPRQPVVADQLHGDPVAAFDSSASLLLAAFRRPGALEETFTMPVGVVTGTIALNLRITETFVHGWDLAQAVAADTDFDTPAVEQQLRFAQAMLGTIAPARRPFGPPQLVATDAPAIDRLVACLGRRP